MNNIDTLNEYKKILVEEKNNIESNKEKILESANLCNSKSLSINERSEYQSIIELNNDINNVIEEINKTIDEINYRSSLMKF